MTSVIIDKRYCGPPKLRERRICLRPAGPAHSGGAEVTLRAPLPWISRSTSSRRTTGYGSFAMAPQSSPPEDRQVLNCGMETASFDEACAAELLDAGQANTSIRCRRVSCAVLQGRREMACAFLPGRSYVNPEMLRLCSRRPGHGSDPDGGGRLRRARISLVGARLSTGYASVTTGERQLRTERRSCWAGCRHG